MNDVRREIVEAVARGAMTPEEAATRLQELDQERSVATVESDAPASDSSLARVRVELSVGSVRVYGDPSVTGAVAEGRHTASREGDTLVIRASGLDSDEGFVFSRRGFHGRVSGRGRVEVRMNPRLALQLLAQAGEVRVEGVEGPIGCEVQAGSVRIDGFRAPLEMNVQAGQVRARGRLDGGTSRIRCDAGGVRLELERGSSVRVRARSALGKVTIDDDQMVMVGGGSREAVIGSGTGTLEIDSTLGTVRVDTER